MTTPKKLFVLGPASSPHVSKWIEPFREEFDITLLTFHPPANPNIYKGVILKEIPRLTGTKADYFLSIPWLWFFLRIHRPALLHAHYASSYGIAMYLAGSGFKRLVTVWGNDLIDTLDRSKASVLNFLINRLFKVADWINVPSRQLFKVTTDLGIDPKKIAIFQYGIDIEEFDKHRCVKTNTKFTIISTRAWQSSLYNVNTILRGFIKAWEENNNLELIVTSGGTEAEEAEVRQIAKECPGIVLKGKISRSELISELWRADVFISIPISDGMPLSVMEAMYCNCYPILSDIPPNRELLELGEGELLWPIDESSVHKAIEQAYKQYQSFNGQNNARFIIENGNYRQNINKLRQVYHSLS